MKILSILCILFLFIITGTAMSNDINYKIVISNIANDILKLKKDYPQLADFTIKDNLHKDQLMITYEYHTHEPTSHIGWTSCVPNPDDDGIWFYIDIHDQNSIAQIHTQSVVPEYQIGNKILFMLILAGKDTKSISSDLNKIIQHYGKIKKNHD